MNPSARSPLLASLSFATPAALDVAGLDRNSLPRFRVRGPLAHSPEFARAFSCDASTAVLSEADRANIW